MCDLMKAGGYYTAIRGKVSHSTPYQPYAWDDDLTTGPDGKKLHMKDVPSYHDCTLQGIAKAKAAGKPFCLNINISDPHKPFWKPNDPHKASKVFTAKEVPIPGFLFDDPVVRKELALYYTSVRRADDAVGAILMALEKSGERENTVVIFLSDHGMPLPFAKTQLYHHSTRTPWMVRWPGVTKPGSVERNYMISAVDLLPTLLDIAGIKHPKGFDGQSFVPIMKGQKQLGRFAIFKVYNENAGGNLQPMVGRPKCLQDRHQWYRHLPANEEVGSRRSLSRRPPRHDGLPRIGGTLRYRARSRLPQESRRTPEPRFYPQNHAGPHGGIHARHQ
jgi:N-sulfoglucosamine sulfohydrolase